ncbi:exopolysaccharide biosynthesis protein [Blastopirellula sp. J2-11]|uniref:exopolysaccharide biosynthesis protein n=1 Tax=Blastopirellula sp. J2-11 TaxID=2943192 RepID=UPI0021C9D610|nr:exopolysaccharide biosynthesis protein [Blastopirellula sp. J2-11]UUO07137.1 exopolysaccharide biosynthesis protein [Blastopirellula sp. J2-11]
METACATEKPENLSDVLDQLVDNTTGENASFGDVMDALNSRSFGPVLLVPAVLAVSPLGAIPGVSIFTGALIFVIAAQMLAARSHIWLPKRLLAFSFSREKLVNSVKSTRPWAVWFEPWIHNRLSFLIEAPFRQAIALVVMILAALFVPLAFLPFAVAVPGTAIALIALGMTAKDGALVLAGCTASIAAIVLAVVFWPF